jgi:polar amino acid transport system substrate-binding protein
MTPVYFKQRSRRASPAALLLGSIVVLFSLLLAACSSGGSTTPGNNSASTAITPPANLITTGVLTVGSDTTYPPQEFIDPTTHKAVGFDVDLITEIAKQMGLQVKIVSTPFATIIDDLAAKHFDVVISAVNITPDRQEKADFIPYLKAGESLLVQKGNPKHITSTDDLCGLAVGVQQGTVEQGVLQSSSDNCLEQEQPEIKITALADQTAVIQLLTTNKVVATYQDSPVTDYYVKQNSSQVEAAGSVFGEDTEGIAVRKGDTAMLQAIQAAFKQVKAAGTYHQLIVKWGIANSELALIDRRRNAA